MAVCYFVFWGFFLPFPAMKIICLSYQSEMHSVPIEWFQIGIILYICYIGSGIIIGENINSTAESDLVYTMSCRLDIRRLNNVIVLYKAICQ